MGPVRWKRAGGSRRERGRAAISQGKGRPLKGTSGVAVVGREKSSGQEELVLVPGLPQGKGMSDKRPGLTWGHTGHWVPRMRESLDTAGHQGRRLLGHGPPCCALTSLESLLPVPPSPRRDQLTGHVRPTMPLSVPF